MANSIVDDSAESRVQGELVLLSEELRRLTAQVCALTDQIAALARPVEVWFGPMHEESAEPRPCVSAPERP